MAILQKIFMIKAPDEIVEKVAIQDKFLDCAAYVSKSGATFNGCMRAKKGDLTMVRGLYKIYGDPLYKFISRGKITRDIDVMKDLILRFLREFNVGYALIYYDNTEIRVYDVFRKVVMLEDTPFISQGHLYVYKLKLPLDFSAENKTTQEEVFNHKIMFTNPVNIYDVTHDDFHIKPGYGFVIQADDVTVKISSPDHGEAIAELSEGLWLFLHSPPHKTID